MESLDGMAQIARNARRTFRASQDSFAQNRINQEAAASSKDVIWKTYLAKGRAKGLDAVIALLRQRYPADPLFRCTGRSRPNGKPELAFHEIMDRATVAAANECPGGIPNARITLFKQRTE